MDGMTIGELARRSGLRVSAIRFYQRCGLLPPRDALNGWQHFNEDAVTRLAVVELAKRTGFTLEQITVLLDAFDTAEAPAGTWRPLLETKLSDIHLRMQHLDAMRDLLAEALSCNCLAMDRAALVPAALGWASDAAAATRPPSTGTGTSAVTRGG